MAKNITRMFMALPPKLKPSHLRIMTGIKELSEVQEYVTVGNVSEFLEITSPSVIKSINELQEMEVVIKEGIPEDKRVTKLTLTPLGEEYYERYVTKYHSWLHELFSDISEDDMKTTVDVINRAYTLMQDSRKKNSDVTVPSKQTAKRIKIK